MPIRYVEADATQPTGEGRKILVHVCNDIGAWGRGSVLGLSQRFPEPERRYKAWAAGQARRAIQTGAGAVRDRLA
ncbi:hypothetical protein Q0M94_01845 [Deinococcus radiomollis]|uniref:hypothetical protein n=1 Tax=Deinococcus radiomollis TaxID=468916 RepID=UPI0038921B96